MNIGPLSNQPSFLSVVVIYHYSRAINWVDCSFGEESMKTCIHTPNNILFEISRGHKLDLSAFVRICPECVRTEGLFAIAPKLVEIWKSH